MPAAPTTPEAVVAFWFPEGDAPEAQEHQRLWNWRLRGGAYHEVVAQHAALTARAVGGELDDWAHHALGRLALIVVLDAWARAVWSGTPRAWAGGPAAQALCLQGLVNGHFDTLPRVWHQAAFLSPLVHVECDEPARHLAHLDTAIAIADRLVQRAPAALQPWYVGSAAQARRHRAVIAQFGRFPHRNALLGRSNTPQELAFMASGDLPRAHGPAGPENGPTSHEGASMIAVLRAESPADIEAVRGLMREFNRWVLAAIGASDNPSIFAEFEAELAGLPGRYGPPSGALVLARLRGEPAGCVAFYAHDNATVEIKRMFVLPQARGHGVGGRMLELLLSQARAAGYRRALLSSHHSMHAAHAIYRHAGFSDVPASADFPGALAGIDVCMSLVLNAGART